MDQEYVDRVSALAHKIDDLFEGERIDVVANALFALIMEMAEQMRDMKGRDNDIDKLIDQCSRTLAQASITINSGDAPKDIARH